MAKKYLDYDGLSYFWLQLKNKLTGKLNDVNYDTTNKKLYKTKEGTNTDIVSVSTLKTDMALTKADVGLGNVTDGAQVNVLEGIQKNGQTVTITNKIANISVPTKTSDITNDSGFITSADVPEGAAASTTTPKMNGTAAIGTQTAFARGDHVHPTDTSRAPLASPALTGIPTAPTATAGTNSTQIATTAFVTSAIQTAQTGAAAFQGTASTTFAPTNYKKGYYWVVGTAGTYVGETCEPGDMIFAIADYSSTYKAADFNVIQTNLDITSITNAEIDTIVAS